MLNPFRASNNDKKKVVRVKQMTGNALYVLLSDRINDSIATIKIIDAEVKILDRHQHPGNPAGAG